MFGILAMALIRDGACPASAQATLDLINEYPANSISGEADAFFADVVKRKTDGRVVFHPIADAKSGLRTREQIKAVSDGKFAMATSFGGALGEESPLFLLSSLPFVSPTDADARKLYDIAQPLYEKLFAERKQKLLYVVPWPPSGIWSAAPLASTDVLKALKIRTYDKTEYRRAHQGRGFRHAGLVQRSQRQAGDRRYERGAVVGRWRRRPAIVEIPAALLGGGLRDAAELRVDLARRHGRASTMADARALEEAGRETSAHQWAALASRLIANYARMRDNGVIIDEHPPADVMVALREAAHSTVDAMVRAAHAGGAEDALRLSGPAEALSVSLMQRDVSRSRAAAS